MVSAVADLHQLRGRRAFSESLVGALLVLSNSVKVAFAFFVVLASPTASLARAAGQEEVTPNMPITTNPSGARKCFQGSRATAAARNRPGIVHSVCWAPRNTTGGPEV
jgi:hypothetical protein